MHSNMLNDSTHDSTSFHDSNACYHWCNQLTAVQSFVLVQDEEWLDDGDMASGPPKLAPSSPLAGAAPGTPSSASTPKARGELFEGLVDTALRMSCDFD